MIIRPAATSLIVLLVAAIPMTVAAAPPGPVMIALPSGSQAYLHEVIIDRLGDMGLTYRYRYVMPDLALLVPPADPGGASDFGPQDINTDDWDDADLEGDYMDDGLISAEDFDFAPVISLPGTEEAADHIIDRTLSADPDDKAPALPPAPVSTFKDPVHDDVIWLCANHVLPDVLKQSERPIQIIISVADQESPFGAYDPEVIQLFEAFALPADRDECDWRPW